MVRSIATIQPKDISTTIVNYTELLFGAFNSIKKKQNFEKVESFLENITILPFSVEEAYFFAEQKAFLKKQGNIIADLDLMIASIGITSESILVTNNMRHFDRIKKLKIENWAK